MAAFRNLEDSPMFRNETLCDFMVVGAMHSQKRPPKTIYSLEQTADELEDRCQKLHRGCKRFMTSLYEAYDGDLAFANCLDAFGAGQDDPTSVTIGGPVMSKFTAAFRELGTYKELLCSQMEYMLSDRLMQFMSVDLQNVKDCRRRFDKATAEYDKAREKFLSLKKSTRAEVVLESEEDLHNSKSAFERCRFNLVNALANIEAKKKYEFLESISAVMDAHMRYFKKGYELLSQMGPFIDEVLTYALQSKEMANTKQDKLAKRILEFRTQSELANLRSSSNVDASSSGDGIHVIGINPYKNIEALMQSTANGQVQTIKQGYLLKQPSNLRGDWKRRFFILDSHGTLYYYGNKWSKKMGPLSQRSAGASEYAGVFGRFSFTHQRTSSPVEDNIGYHTVDLQTSKIKIDAEQTDLRFCFRIISPAKTYTLQAESAAEQMDWVEKITGVIASLLNSPFLMKLSSGESNILSCSSADAHDPDSLPLEDRTGVEIYDDVSRLLRGVPGNDACAECGSPEPDWASLNLGILVCIECSGVHRNLGVHISKVRSLTLDVKVWEPIVVDLFRALGNAYCNSVWEEFLLSQDERMDESNMDFLSIQKPRPKDTVLEKEKYIQAKYVDKLLIKKETTLPVIPPQAIRIWDAVKSNDIRGAYRLLVASNASPNTRYDEVSHDLYHTANTPMSRNSAFTERKQFDPANCQKINDSGEPESCMQGCSLLHLACHVANPVMLELLLQFGADINIQDLQGRTPLHHCILKKNNSLAKYLIKRGVDASIKDGGGLTALERAMELGAVIDEELLMLLSGNH